MSEKISLDSSVEKQRRLFTKSDIQTGKNCQLRVFTPCSDSFQEGFHPIYYKVTSSGTNYSTSPVR